MDEDNEAMTSGEAPADKPARVRIIGAEPAGQRLGETPAAEADLPDAGTTGGGPLDLGAFLDQPLTPAGGELAPEPYGDAATVLPHWTEAPTGEVPAVLARESAEVAEADGDQWTALPGPTWREEHTDWTAGEEAFEPAVLADDETRVGAEDVTNERQPWEFELTTAGDDGGEAGRDAMAGFGTLDEYRDDETMVVPAMRRASAPSERFDDLGDRSDRVVVGERRGEGVGEDDLVGADDEVGGGPDEGPGTPQEAVLPRPRRGASRAGRLRGRGEAEDRVLLGGTAPARPDALGRPAPTATRPASRAPQPRRPVRPRPGEYLQPPVVAATPEQGRNMPVAIASGLAIGIVALVCFKFGNLPALVISTIVITLAAIEVFAALRTAGFRPVTLLGLVATVSLMIATYNRGLTAVPLLLVLLFVFTLLWHLAGVDRNADAVSSTAATMMAFCWIGVFGSFAALLLNPVYFPERHGVALLFGAIVAVVAYDVGALIFGTWIGRHPLAPHASPNKTWEGFFGGAVAALLVSVLIVSHLHPWSVGSAAALGLAVAVASPIGDLSESIVKRHLGLKDMGRILPGHGGVLDRVDGLLFVLPATYYLAKAFHLG